MIFSLNRHYPKWCNPAVDHARSRRSVTRKHLKKAMMRLHLILFVMLFTAFVATASRAKAQNVSLDAKATPLYQVFKKIEKQTGYLFWYKGKMLGKNTPITVSFTDLPLKTALDKIFVNVPFTYEIVDETIVVKDKPAAKESKKENQQKKTVTGTITDEKGEPLAGATVKVKGTENVVLTDQNGRFLLKDVNDDGIIQIIYVGYILKEVPAKNDLGTIKLQQATGELQNVEIVSTGYQKIPKERATGSFVQVDNELLNRRVSTNIIDRLQGVASSVLFNANIPTLSTESPFSVRGRSTILSNTQPLIVLDNFAYDGSLSNINPNDIESITILKDAAAASIWGVRSGNGVIVITSKKGKTNQALNVELNANYTVGNKPDLFYSPNFLNASDYIDNEIFLFGKGNYDANLNSTTTRPIISPVVEILASQKSGTISATEATTRINSLRGYDIRNDYEKYLYRKNQTSQYALNLRGGAEKFTYYLSTGYDKNISNIVGNQNDRLNLNAISTFTPVKNLDIGLGLNFTQSNNTDNGTGAAIYPANRSAYYPYARLADDNGNPLPIEKTYRSSFLNTQSGILNWQYNPIDEINFANNTTRINYVRITPSVSYKILSGINIEARYQYESSQTDNKNIQSIDTYFTRDLINLFTQGSGGNATFPIPKGGIFDRTQTNLKGNSFRANLNIDRQIINLDHSVSAVAGIELKELISERNVGRLYGYDPLLTTSTAVNYETSYTRYQNLASPSKIPYVDAVRINTDEYMSYFANAAYSFKQRYTISGSGRIDESNLFGVNTNQKSIPLWSVGASWNISKEPFYKIAWLSDLKARLTYGENGNINKNLTAYTTAAFLSSPLTSARSALIQNPPNADLRWERNRMFNAGVDFNIKNHLLAGSIEYYYKKGIDLLGQAPLDPTTGVTQYTSNLANMTGQGIDIDLNATIYNRKFKWQVFLLNSWNTDRVTKYDMTIPVITYVQSGDGLGGVTINPIVGKPVYSVSSYRWANLDPTTGDPQGYLNGQISKDYTALTSSTVKLQDLVYNGPARPNFFGSFRNEFGYKQFSLSVNFTYKFNYYFRRPSLQYSQLNGSWLGNRDYTKRWQKTGDETFTNVPSLIYPVNINRNNFYQYSEELVEKGDHIRFQDVQLTFRLENNSSKKLGLKNLQIYSYINNVGLIWKANKARLDPDAVNQYNFLMYPTPTTYALGLRSNF